MVADNPRVTHLRSSPEKKHQMECEKIVAMYLAGMPIKDCLMLVAGTALARAVFTQDNALVTLAAKIVELAENVSK